MPRLCRGETAQGRKEKRAARPAFAMAKQRRVARKSGRHAPAFSVAKQRRVARKSGRHAPAFSVAKQRRSARKSGRHAPPLPWRNSAGAQEKAGGTPRLCHGETAQGREEKIRADAFSPSAGRFRAALLPGKRHGRDEKTEKKRLFFQKCAIIFSKTLDFRKNYAIIDKDRIDEYEEWLASHSSFHVRAHDAPPLYAKTEFPRRRIHEKRNQRHRA